MLEDVISGLEAYLRDVPRQMRQFSHDEISRPRSEGKWSRLQILGHLCDSAVNNLSCFIQAQSRPEPLVVTSYNQETWVEAQQYISAPVENVVNLWVSLNQSVIRVVSHMPAAGLARSCQLPDGGTVTLEWLIRDYLRHMEHHLGQIFAAE